MNGMGCAVRCDVMLFFMYMNIHMYAIKMAEDIDDDALIIYQRHTVT